MRLLTTATGWGTPVCQPTTETPSRRGVSEVVHRVDRRAVDAHLEVHVRTSRVAGGTGERDLLAPRDRGADAHEQLTVVGVERGERAAVIDHHGVAVATH